MADRGARADYLAARQARATAVAELSERLTRAADAEAALAAAGGPDAAPELARALADRQAEAAAAAQAVAKLDDRAAGLRRAAVGTDEFGLLEPGLPTLLLPVRLEVRPGRPDGPGWSFDGKAPATHLVVRIYPDQVHIDAHEPELTAAEQRALAAYSARRPRLPADADDVLPAWAELVAQVGPFRARWLAGLVAPGGGVAKPGRRPGAPSRAAQARLLPDRWLVRVSFDPPGTDATAIGGLVTEPLPVGPDPRTATGGLDWLSGLPAAFAAGMAVAVSLGGRSPAEIARVVCAGVRGTLPAAEAAAELAALLTAHRCTDGFDLLAPGTPTTSTGAGRAGRDERAAPTVVDAYRESRLALVPDSDGSRLAAALGLDPASVLRVDRADGAELSTERAAIGLLGHLARPALTDLLAPTVTTAAAAVDYAVERVSAVGPLPAVRIGSQPYGVLPVGRILHGPDGSAWRTDPVVGVLERFRAEVWAPAADAVPRIRPGLSEPEQTLVELLRRDGAPAGYQVRLAAPPPVAGALLGLPGGPDSFTLREMRRATAARLAATLGAGPASRLAGLALAPAAAAGTAPLVTALGQLPADYLGELVGTPLATLPDPALGAGRPLLFHLARAALLEATDLAARRVLADAGQQVDLFPAWSAGESSTVDEAAWTVWDRLGYGVSAVDTAASWLDTHPADPRAGELADVRLRLTVLQAAARPQRLRPQPALEPILRAALGLSSRLDAWYTAVAAARLGDLRTATPTGVQVGGYGVLDGIMPGSLGSPVAGYVHAPGYPHAAAAAVLRSAHLARSDGEQDPAVARSLAANLSSARVRDALRLLDGLRAGQSTGALLGQRVEERLAAAGRQVLIAPLRDRFPLVAGRLVPTAGDEAPAAAAATAVLDGEAALRATGFPNPPTADPAFLPDYRPLQPAEVADLSAALDTAAGTLDALGDLLLAEGVFQLAQGNASRASAALDFLAGAPVGVPEPEIVRTPHSAHATPVRLLAVLPAAGRAGGAGAAGWPVTPRELAEPALAAWAATALPAPADIAVAGQRAVPGEAPEPVGGTLADLNAAALAAGRPDLAVGPLDLVFAAAGPARDASHPLSARLCALLAYTEGAAPNAVTIDPTATAAGGAAEGAGALFSVLAAGQVGSRLREVVLGARALEPADLTAEPAAGPWLAPDAADIGGRAVAARGALDELAAELGGWLAAAGTVGDGVGDRAAAATSVAAARPLLARADQYGVAGALPLGWDEPLADCRLRVAAVQREAARRVAATPAVPGDAATAAAALRTLFGGTFLAVPVLRPTVAGAVDTVRARLSAGAGEPDPATELTRWAAVRPPAGRLEVVDLLARAAGADRAMVRLLDLPVHTPAGGAARAISYEPAGDPWATPALCGLALDAWVDTTPAATETTTLAFGVDTPTSEPPNLWLLAVPALNHDTWTAADLFSTVDEALDLARLRAVGPTDLGADQLLPPWWLWTEPRDPGPHWGTDPDQLTHSG